jgi:hypothetical protein
VGIVLAVNGQPTPGNEQDQASVAEASIAVQNVVAVLSETRAIATQAIVEVVGVIAALMSAAAGTAVTASTVEQVIAASAQVAATELALQESKAETENAVSDQNAVVAELTAQLETVGLTAEEAATLETRIVAAQGDLLTLESEYTSLLSVVASLDEAKASIQSLLAELQSGAGNPGGIAPRLSNSIAILIRAVENFQTTLDASVNKAKEALAQSRVQGQGLRQSLNAIQVIENNLNQLRLILDQLRLQAAIDVQKYGEANVSGTAVLTKSDTFGPTEGTAVRMASSHTMATTPGDSIDDEHVAGKPSAELVVELAEAAPELTAELMYRATYEEDIDLLGDVRVGTADVTRQAFKAGEQPVEASETTEMNVAGSTLYTTNGPKPVNQKVEQSNTSNLNSSAPFKTTSRQRWSKKYKLSSSQHTAKGYRKLEDNGPRRQYSPLVLVASASCTLLVAGVGLFVSARAMRHNTRAAYTLVGQRESGHTRSLSDTEHHRPRVILA